MKCQFCPYLLEIKKSTPEFDVYPTFCPNCNIQYKLNNLNKIIFIMIEHKKTRLLYINDDEPCCLLQVKNNNINLPIDTIQLKLHQIYSKIDNLLPFI